MYLQRNKDISNKSFDRVSGHGVLFFLYKFFTLNWKAWFNRWVDIIGNLIRRDQKSPLNYSYLPQTEQKSVLILISFSLFRRDTILLEQKENVANETCFALVCHNQVTPHYLFVATWQSCSVLKENATF